METGIRVGIVDSYAIVRDGLKVFLETTDDLLFVGDASSTEEACWLCVNERPDVILFDYLQADCHDTALIEQLLGFIPEVGIIVLTTVTDYRCVVAALQAGVYGYVYKQASIDALAGAIRAVHGRTRLLDKQVCNFPDAELLAQWQVVIINVNSEPPALLF